MSNFGQSWQRKPSQGISEHIQGMIKKEQPLKPRVEGAIKRLNKPISKLDSTSKQLSQKEQKIFSKIIQAKQNGNIHVAKALANELAQMRKTNSMVGNMKLSIEKTQIRLSTVSAVGDTIVAMKPAVSTMKTVVPAMSNIMSQASTEMESMGDMLGDMMPGSIGDDSFADSTGSSSQEMDSILQEAAAVAETQIGDKFPSAPTVVSDARTSADSLTSLD
jgi:division protein CdvB (Snf7/Vps24/ESCRT-III family)